MNNRVSDEKLNTRTEPFKKIVNNLANDETSDSCNKCKESCDVKLSVKKPMKNGGIVNLGFVDNVAEASSWFQPHMPRHLATSLLLDSSVGSFVVRHSESQMGFSCLALTIRVPKSFNGVGILHYLILVNEVGFRIKGLSKVFPSLSALVVHHSVMKETLPCRLLLEDDSDSEEDSDKEGDFADLDADPEYPSLLSRLRLQLSQ